MRTEAKFLILLSLTLSQCIGAPPQKDSTKTTRGPAYTDQEDESIVQELLRLPYNKKPLFGSAVWDKIAQKHNAKWQKGTFGFPQERSMESLRNRFKHVLQHNFRDNVKVPEILLQKLATQRKPNKGKSYTAYNAEEKKLIFEELLKPSCKTLYGTSTWDAIRAEHDRRRLVDKHPAFQNERTSQGLRSRMFDIVQRDELPDEIVKKFGLPQKGASTSKSALLNQQTDLQVTNDRQDEKNEWITEMIEELLNNSDYEVDFSKLEPKDE